MEKIRNPVAKNGPKFNKSVRFADRKLNQKQGYTKHRNRKEEEHVYLRSK